MEVSARWLSSVSGRSLLSDSWYPAEFAIIAPCEGPSTPIGAPVERKSRYPSRTHASTMSPSSERSGACYGWARGGILGDDERAGGASRVPGRGPRAAGPHDPLAVLAQGHLPARADLQRLRRPRQDPLRSPEPAGAGLRRAGDHPG